MSTSRRIADVIAVGIWRNFYRASARASMQRSILFFHPIRLHNAGIESKLLRESSNVFHRLIGASFQFLSHTALTILQGNLSVEALNSKAVVGEFAAVDRNRMSETVPGRHVVTWISNRKSQVADRSISVLMTSSDLGAHFLGDLCTYTRSIWPTTTKFGMVTCGDGAYFRGQTRPIF